MKESTIACIILGAIVLVQISIPVGIIAGGIWLGFKLLG